VSTSPEVRLMVFWSTREEVLRTLATVRRSWRKIASALGTHDARFVRASMRLMARDIRAWCAPIDLARVDVRHCRDLKCLRLAFDDVMPHAAKTSEALGHILDAASSGRWNAYDEDVEVYRRTRGEWVMVRERGKDVEQ